MSKIFYFTSIFIFFLVSCDQEQDTILDIDPCINHESGYDEICGCPGLQVGFSNKCLNTREVDGLVYYFARVDFYCLVDDSIAIGIDVTNQLMYPNYIDAQNPGNIAKTNSNCYEGGQIFNSSLTAPCRDADLPIFETTYFYPNATTDEIDGLPDELEFHFVHKEDGIPADFIPTIDSTTVVFVKDANRR